MNLSISKIKEILSGIKSIKDDFMYITEDGTVYSTNEFFNYLKILKTDIIGYTLSFKTTEINAFIKNMDKYNSDCRIVTDSFNNLYLHPTVNIRVPIDDDPIYPAILNCHIPNFINLINKVIGYNSIGYDYAIDNIRDNESFNTIISQKAADGVSLFNIDNEYMITLCSRLFPINKKDKVEFKIKNLDSCRSFVGVRIYKTKTTIVEMYIIILNLK